MNQDNLDTHVLNDKQNMVYPTEWNIIQQLKAEGMIHATAWMNLKLCWVKEATQCMIPLDLKCTE